MNFPPERSGEPCAVRLPGRTSILRPPSFSLMCSIGHHAVTEISAEITMSWIHKIRESRIVLGCGSRGPYQEDPAMVSDRPNCPFGAVARLFSPRSDPCHAINRLEIRASTNPQHDNPLVSQSSSYCAEHVSMEFRLPKFTRRLQKLDPGLWCAKSWWMRVNGIPRAGVHMYHGPARVLSVFGNAEFTMQRAGYVFPQLGGRCSISRARGSLCISWSRRNLYWPCRNST